MTWAWSLLGCCLLPGLYLIYKDITEYILPNAITYFILLSGLGYGIYQGTIIKGLVGGLVCFLIVFIVAVVSQILTGFAGIGGGDIKLLAGLGVWFGYNDVITSIQVMMIGFVFALVFSLIRQKGVIRHLINYVKGLAWMSSGVKGQIPATDFKDGKPEKAIPLGAFIIIAAWCVWIGGFLG